ncbi:MAG: hypothetical protein COU71_01505 [Parcubacteria group bacterium CG10_big_fil_rev_8_21_14_0_10_38_31]|nr:MAG: hypothetical protein COU71_01505 [Parcubacteria group bacterium CG10_big_fil_rev_8_21_14_0_10_38_31]
MPIPPLQLNKILQLFSNNAKVKAGGSRADLPPPAGGFATATIEILGNDTKICLENQLIFFQNLLS